MRLYLSSFRLGNQAATLKELIAGRSIGLIPNAVDHLTEDERRSSNERALQEVRDTGVDIEVLDLKSFFGAAAELEQRLAALGGVWVRGGNTFVLRQAMRLSGFDDLITGMTRPDFLYGGYSAGVCVLAPRLEGIQYVDQPDLRPYPGSEVIWEGLGLLDYLILPHYRSNHPESADMEHAVEYCRRSGIAYRTLRDGEVIVR